MKNRIISLILIILISVHYWKPLAGKEKITEKIKVNLIDLDINYPFLRAMKGTGFFNLDGYEFNIIQNNKAIPYGAAHINLYGMPAEINGNLFYEFSLFSAIGTNTVMKINWQIPEGEDFLRRDSIRKLLELSRQSKAGDINDIIVNNNIWYKNGYPFSVSYEERGLNSAAKSYDFTIETGNPPGPRFWRTFFEIVSVSAMGAVKYWIDLADNKEDWEYPPTREGFKKKLKDPWSFDKNSFQTNTIDHIWAGSLYYQAARSNGYGFVGAAVWSFMGSIFWEYIAEYREAVSINDVIFTPTGAFMGEGLRQASIYVEKKAGHTIPGKIFMFLLDPIRILNRGLDRLNTSSYRVNIIFFNPAQALADQSGLLK